MTAARGLASSLGVLTGLFLLGSVALADGATRVVLLGPAADHPLVFRLRRELELVGLEVDLVVDAGAARRDLAGVVQERHAAAAIAVETSPPVIVVWADPGRQPGGTAGPEIRVDAGADDPRLPVLRAVENLRERLLPGPPPSVAPPASAPPPPPASAQAPSPPPSSSAAPSPPPSSQPPSPPPSSSPPPSPPPSSPPPPASPLPAPPAAPPSTRGPSGFVGAAILTGPGGVGATPPVWLGARWAPVPRLDLELVAFIPTAAASVSAAEGSMSVRAGAIGAGVGVRVGDPAGSFFADAGAGLGALLATFDGQATAPWRSASGMRASMLPYAHTAAGYWFAQHVAIRADLLAGFALPEPVLVIAGRRVAFFGEPAIVVAAGIEVRP